jgi:hypothetical protein
LKKKISSASVYLAAALVMGAHYDAVYGARPVTRHTVLLSLGVSGLSYLDSRPYCRSGSHIGRCSSASSLAAYAGQILLALCRKSLFFKFSQSSGTQHSLTLGRTGQPWLKGFPKFRKIVWARVSIS